MVKIFDKAIIVNLSGKSLHFKLGPHQFLGQEHTWHLTIREGDKGHDTNEAFTVHNANVLELSMHIDQEPKNHENEGHSNKATKFSRKEKRALR